MTSVAAFRFLFTGRRGLYLVEHARPDLCSLRGKYLPAPVHSPLVREKLSKCLRRCGYILYLSLFSLSLVGVVAILVGCITNQGTLLLVGAIICPSTAIIYFLVYFFHFIFSSFCSNPFKN